MIGKKQYEELLRERPRKFRPPEVEYAEAPPGSAIICAACLHYFRRAVDGLATCEIMRSEETDRDGVRPNWRCRFQTSDGDVFPLLPEEETIPALEEEPKMKPSLEVVGAISLGGTAIPIDLGKGTEDE